MKATACKNAFCCKVQSLPLCSFEYCKTYFDDVMSISLIHFNVLTSHYLVERTNRIYYLLRFVVVGSRKSLKWYNIVAPQ